MPLKLASLPKSLQCGCAGTMGDVSLERCASDKRIGAVVEESRKFSSWKLQIVKHDGSGTREAVEDEAEGAVRRLDTVLCPDNHKSNERGKYNRGQMFRQ